MNMGFTDNPQPHPLRYFKMDPCQRPASDKLVASLQCSSGDTSRTSKTQTRLTEIGNVGAFRIYDLWCYRDADNPNEPSLRSILVKTAGDQYREINVRKLHGSLTPSSEIVNLGGEPILVAKSHDGGNHNRIDEQLYMFRPSGIVAPDFKAVNETAAKLTPTNMSVRGSVDDYTAMTVLVELYRNDLGLPPVSVTERARILITYRFVNGRAIVISSNYTPYSL